MDENTKPEGQEILLWGYPLSLWIIATVGLLSLTALLALFLWQLAQEPLHFEMTEDQPPAVQAPHNP